MGEAIRFLRMGDLRQKVGLSRSQIYKLIADGDFPKQNKLGERISVWEESKVEEWMVSKINVDEEDLVTEVEIESEEEMSERVLNRHQGGGLSH
jgi:prophage regulatory protein